jgi:hypothetical protein
MPGMHTGIVKRFTEPLGIAVKVLENGEMIEVGVD